MLLVRVVLHLMFGVSVVITRLQSFAENVCVKTYTEALQMIAVTTSAWGQWARALAVAARNSGSRRNLRDTSNSD